MIKDKLLKKLEAIYLDDSYVLNIEQTANELIFKMEFVLLENHEEYSPPLPNEMYCYKNGLLIFSGCSSINWINKSGIINTDKNGEEDMGNIDALTIASNRVFLEGDWGQVELACNELDVRFETIDS